MWLAALRVLSVCVLCGAAGRLAPQPRVYRDVATSQGAARGYLVSDPPHFAYFGLPYARPPTRRDRFKAPKPPPEWDGVFEATHKIKCPQVTADGEENCLVVNVFTPEHAVSLPVIVFVHGGDFQNGWGAHQPPVKLLTQEFLIVTFNYRLGALGFLCLGTKDAPGNAGLKDQVAALYWVNRNIAKFGGNPRDVTVYGTESGAASVQLLLLSGLAKGLLHKVVLESGSVLSPASMTYDPLSIAYKGATSLGYEESEDAEELYKFYQESVAENLVNIPDMFLPCIENESDFLHSLVDTDPMKILEDGKYHNVPMMITFTEKDSISKREDIEKFREPPEEFEHMLPNNLDFDNRRVKQSVGEIVKQFYFEGHSNVVKSYANYVHDIFTEYPIMKMAILFAAKSTHNVYVMRFTIPQEVESAQNSRSIDMRSIDTILDYLYREDMELDDTFVEKILVLWKNFIKLGDPTPLISTLIPVMWQPVSPMEDGCTDISRVPIFQLDSDVRMKLSPAVQRLKFWDNIYTRFYRPLVLEEVNEETDDNISN